jgi:hypothetical protein
MIRNLFLSAFICVHLWLMSAVSPAAPALQLLPAWERLAPTAVKGPSYTGGLYLARGETRSFQLAAWSTGPQQLTATIPAGLTATLYLEAWARVTKVSTYSSQTNKPLPAGLYPDGLRPLKAGDTIACEAGKPTIIWVDVTAARTAKSGVSYLYLNLGGASRAMRVTIWNFTMPVMPFEQTAFTLWANRGKAQPEEELLRHRISTTFTIPSHAPRLAGLGQNAVSIGYWAAIDKKTAAIAKPRPTMNDVLATKAAYAAIPFPYVYLADEVYNDACAKPLYDWSAALRGAGMPVMITIAPRPKWEWLDIYCELPKFHVQANVNTAIARGAEVWSYNCLAQDGYSPKWLIQYRYSDFVLQGGFLNWTHRLTGMLYWAVDKGGADPWTNAEPYGAGYAGEGFLMYPLPDGTLAPSIRLKWLRDGIEDYDYLTLAAIAGEMPLADEVARSVAPDWRNWSRDPVAIEAARRRLGNRLNAIGG